MGRIPLCGSSNECLLGYPTLTSARVSGQRSLRLSWRRRSGPAASSATPPRAGRLSCPPPRHRGHPLPATSVADLPPLLRPTGSSSYYLRLAAGVQGSSKLVIVILMLV
jgi:hypothetical protein